MTTEPGAVRSIVALEFGDWRRASHILHEDGLTDPKLVADLRIVARAMSHRAAGEHGAAWRALGVVAASMRRNWSNVSSVLVKDAGLRALSAPWNGEVERLALPPKPDTGGHAELVFRTLRLIWREQGELGRLHRLVAENRRGLTRDKHILVLAFVEYLCWLRHDPNTWRGEPPVDEEAAAVESRIGELRDQRRAAFLCSATNLRHLRYPGAGDMSRMVWNGVGRYNGLMRLAIEELAGRGEPPWVDHPNPGDCPARLGAVNASEFACRA